MELDTENKKQKEQWIFKEILDSMIVDVASESHRAARLGFDSRFENNEECEENCEDKTRIPTNPNTNVDIFGQSQPAVADEILQCMNCGRSVAAGRFAPHLDKCMGKGRKAARTRSVTSQQQRRGQVSNAPFGTLKSHTGGLKLSNGSSSSGTSNKNPM